MQEHLDLTVLMTDVASEPAGLRSDSTRICEIMVSGLKALYGFVLFEDLETGEISVAAAAGLDAVAFRRLEARATRTALSRAIERGEADNILVNDEPSLEFLADPAITSEIFSHPLVIDNACLGSVSVAIDKRKHRDRKVVRSVLATAANVIAAAYRMDRLRREVSAIEEDESHSQRLELQERFDLANIIGNSGPMRQVAGQVSQVARSNANVLLRGEAGTGKEMIAGTIHYNSLRSKRPFVKFGCGSIPSEMIETELFGTHDPGRMDGAKARKGKIDEAEGGTLFIDEIADLSLPIQARLLSLIERRQVIRPGTAPIKRSKVRVIAASRRPLEDLTASGTFLSELLESIGLFTIFLPPLRERKSDVLLLAEHFVEKHGAAYGKRIKRISTPAIDMLTAYHFPGNVRELENAIERAVIACDSSVIHGRHLPPTLQTAEASRTVTNISLSRAVETFERDLIQDALKSSRGNIARAARALSTTERILGYKIKTYGIEAARFRR